MAELSFADSSAGPLMIRMRAAFFPAGRCWEAVWCEKIRMLTETAITNRSSLLMCGPADVSRSQKAHRRRGRDPKCHSLLRLFTLACKVDKPEEKNCPQLSNTGFTRGHNAPNRIGCPRFFYPRFHSVLEENDFFDSHRRWHSEPG
jgi:hypothetical protein